MVTVDQPHHLADEPPVAAASLFESPENTEGIKNRPTSAPCRLHISLPSLRTSLNIVMDTNIYLLTKFKGDRRRLPLIIIFTFMILPLKFSQCRMLNGYHNILIVIAKLNIVGSLRDREVACSTSDSQGANPVSGEQCHLIHIVNDLLAQFRLYVHKSGPAESPDHFIFVIAN